MHVQILTKRIQHRQAPFADDFHRQTAPCRVVERFAPTAVNRHEQAIGVFQHHQPARLHVNGIGVHNAIGLSVNGGQIAAEKPVKNVSQMDDMIHHRPAASQFFVHKPFTVGDGHLPLIGRV